MFTVIGNGVHMGDKADGRLVFTAFRCRERSIEMALFVQMYVLKP